MYLRQKWHDPRLAYSPNETNVPYIIMHNDVVDRFWQPDTFLENEVQGRLHDILVKNMNFRIHQDGEIFTSHRWAITRQLLLYFNIADALNLICNSTNSIYSNFFFTMFKISVECKH